MDARQLSAYTKLSLQTIYNLVHTNQIPYTRVSKKRAEFDKDEIDEWLKTRKRKKRQPKLLSVEEPISQVLAECPSGAGGPTQPDVFPFRNSGLPPLRHSLPALTLWPFVTWVVTALLFIAIGWGGGFLHFRYRAISDPLRLGVYPSANRASGPESKVPSSGVIEFVSLLEQGQAGRIDVRIPSTESDKAEVHLNRILDIEIQSEAASLIKPLLIQALKDVTADYASKSKTIDIVRPYAEDPKVQEAIIFLAKNEKDPAIRLKAVSVLDKVVGNENVKLVLLDRLLNDDNTGIRFKALEIIEKNMDTRSLLVLNMVKDKEPDENIRNKAKAIFDRYERNII